MPPRTLAELAALVGATLEGDGARTVDGPAALDEAGEREVSFLGDARYAAQLRTTRAAGVLLPRDFRCERSDLVLLRCDRPGRAFSTIVQALAPVDPPPRPGVHPTAVVAPGACVDAGAHVGPLCVIEEGARVETGVVLVAGVHVGRECVVGAGSVLHPRVVLYARVVLGERCVLHAGCVVGSEGFGFDPGETGWIKVPQCGTVRVGSDVEIGANTTIDRARFGATRIADGVKIDNLVQVGHNCVLEEGALLCAQVGLAGTTRVGRRAVLAGQAGVGGHLTVGAGARVGGQAGVFGDVPPGEDWAGWPARPRSEALRAVAASRRVPELLERLRALEERLGREDGGRA